MGKELPSGSGPVKWLSEQDILHNQFATVLELLTQAMYVLNENRDHSLAAPLRLDPSPFDKWCPPAITHNQSLRLKILEAFRTLLVRKSSDVCAAAAFNPSISFEPSPQNDTSCIPELKKSYTFFVMQELQSDHHFEPDSDLDLRKHTHFSSMDSDANQDVACISGEPFWLSVLENPWNALGNR